MTNKNKFNNNIQEILIFLFLCCCAYPITINSELIEFNNKFFIPNNYKPFTGDVQDFYSQNNALLLEGSYLNGLKHGQFTYYFENGNVYRKESFLNGEHYGDLLEFDIDGISIYKKSFIDNGFIYTSFYKNSKIKLFGQFADNYMEGKWVEYHKNGSIKSEKFYNNGILDSSKTKNYVDRLMEDDALKIEQTNLISVEKRSSISSIIINEIEDGEHIIYYDNNNPKIKEHYLNNKLNNEWIAYYESGRILIKRFYDNGILDSLKQTLKLYESGSVMEQFHEVMISGSIVKSGLFSSYYEDGSIKESGNYANNNKTGQWISHYQTGEKLYTIDYGDLRNYNPIDFYYRSENLFYSCYVGSAFDFEGQFISYYESGEIMEKGEYRNNLKDGLWVQYYDSGEIFSQTNYVDGHGIYSEFFKTGEIQESGYFMNNKKEGSWISYYINGNKKQIVKYEGGKVNINEPCLSYSEQGLIETEKLVKEIDDLLINDGKYISYYDNGTIREKGIYINNLKDGLWNEFYNDGAIKSVISFENGNGLFKSYYTDGKLLLEGNYINNKKNGKWIEYSNKGNKYREYYYLHDKLNPNKISSQWYDSGYKQSEGYLLLSEGLIIWDGDYVEYHENGVIYLEGEYDNGVRNGVWKQYYVNRSINSIKYYKNGNPYGKWTFYNKSGEVVKIENY